MKSNVVLIGMPGCGKSTIGKMLSKETGLSFYDIDEEIEKTMNKSILELFKKGEEYFRNIESDIVNEISNKEYAVISTGGGVVGRKENIIHLKEKGKIIFIDRNLSNILEDIDTEKRPLIKNRKTNLIKIYEERIHLYKEYSDYIIKNESSLYSVVRKIILKLNLK
ncbi:shikimate kinase [Haloimpatiens sp. FM7315]|uniref:shikimate kinase n=1 Tax=Haloimpatiens sp. FM7315 TaxID=3298609 RepID=UPI0035A2A59A